MNVIYIPLEARDARAKCGPPGVVYIVSYSSHPDVVSSPRLGCTATGESAASGVHRYFLLSTSWQITAFHLTVSILYISSRPSD